MRFRQQEQPTLGQIFDESGARLSRTTRTSKHSQGPYFPVQDREKLQKEYGVTWQRSVTSKCVLMRSWRLNVSRSRRNFLAYRQPEFYFGALDYSFCPEGSY
jgi:hypothetical protein